MSTRTITVEVNNEYFSGAGLVAGAAGSANDVILRTKFNAMWDGVSKYATFRDAHGENPVVISIGLDKLVSGTTDTFDIPVPAEAKAVAGLMSVTFTGYTIENGNEVDTVTNSAQGKMRVLPADAIQFDDGSVTPSIAQQLRTEIDTLIEGISEAGEHAQHAQEAAAEAQAAADEITGMTVSAEEGAEAAVEKTGGGGEPVNLHFTLPRGAQGEDGEDGADGVGFNNTTQIEETTTANVTVSETGISTVGIMTANTTEGEFSFRQETKIPLAASNGITLKPKNNGSDYWAGVELSGYENANVGDIPMKGSDRLIWGSGGGGGDGLYLHNVFLTNGNDGLGLSFYCSQSTAFTTVEGVRQQLNCGSAINIGGLVYVNTAMFPLLTLVTDTQDTLTARYTATYGATTLTSINFTTLQSDTVKNMGRASAVGTWLFNTSPQKHYSTYPKLINIDFTSNGETYHQIKVDGMGGTQAAMFYQNIDGTNSKMVYATGNWPLGNEYKTINVTSAASDQEALDYLQATATKQ